MAEPELTKISYNATPRTLAAVELVSDRSGLTKTEAANRGLQIYAALMYRHWWSAVKILRRERKDLHALAHNPPGPAADQLTSHPDKKDKHQS